MSSKISPGLIIVHEPLYPEDYELRHYKYVDVLRGMLFSAKNNKIKYLRYLGEIKDLLGDDYTSSNKILMSLKQAWRFLKKGFGELEDCSKLKRDLMFRNSAEERINASKSSGWAKLNRRHNVAKIFLRLPNKDKTTDTNKDNYLEASILRFKKNIHKYKNIKSVGIEGKLSTSTIENLNFLNSVFSQVEKFQGFSIFLEDTPLPIDDSWNNVSLF